MPLTGRIPGCPCCNARLDDLHMPRCLLERAALGVRGRNPNVTVDDVRRLGCGCSRMMVDALGNRGHRGDCGAFVPPNPPAEPVISIAAAMLMVGAIRLGFGLFGWPVNGPGFAFWALNLVTVVGMVTATVMLLVFAHRRVRRRLWQRTVDGAEPGRIEPCKRCEGGGVLFIPAYAHLQPQDPPPYQVGRITREDHPS